ncbi:hypothetical protein H5410_042027 [Solanum commersonii]|uniref:Uncharacterized protein n=1 Tax=Solanum commersonii TaxID=4109 RepID=A0A9J5XTK7_SOLCO|nr:hypothetical protein H5410_042027 [Solanum commersonii]
MSRAVGLIRAMFDGNPISARTTREDVQYKLDITWYGLQHSIVSKTPHSEIIPGWIKKYVQNQVQGNEFKKMQNKKLIASVTKLT